MKEPAEWFVVQAMVGRGRYRKRIDIKGRGRFGVRRRPSCFLRIVVGQPDRQLELKRALLRHVNRRMRRVPREDKPVYLRLKY
jgi:hypothetical protein